MKIIHLFKILCVLFLLSSDCLIISYHLKVSIKPTKKKLKRGNDGTKSLKELLKESKDTKTYSEYSKEFNDIKAKMKESNKYRDELQRYMSKVIANSVIWAKNDDRQKIIKDISESEYKAFYQKMLWLPKLHKIMADMSTVEEIDQVISFCKKLAVDTKDKQCSTWIEMCNQKKDNLKNLIDKSKDSSNASAITAEIDKQEKKSDTIKVAKSVEEKINLACKKAITDATPPKFCWREKRTSVPGCSEGYIQHTAGLCYKKCDQGFFYELSMCKLPCDRTEYSLALDCVKKNNIFDWRSRKSYSPESYTMFNKNAAKCPADLPHHIGALCYRKCPPGTVDCGCCACSIDEKTCGIEITKMAISFAKGLAKMISFALTAGGGSAIVETFSKTLDIVLSVVEGIASTISKVFDAMASAYSAFMNGIDDENKAIEIYKTFVKNIAFKKYLLPELKDDEKTSTQIKDTLIIQCDRLSVKQWNTWKAAHKKKMETNKDINSSEAKQIVKETFIESGVSAFSLIDLIESQNKNDLLNMMEESTVNGGNVAGSILGLFDLIKQVVETKDAYAETNKVETSKKVLSIVEIWDPTGITTIANALLQPGCNDDPIYTEEINKVNKSKRRK